MPNVRSRQIHRVALQVNLFHDASVQVAPEKRTHGPNRRWRIERAQGAHSCVRRRVTPVPERVRVLWASLDWFCSDVLEGVGTFGTGADDLQRRGHFPDYVTVLRLAWSEQVRQDKPMRLLPGEHNVR